MMDALEFAYWINGFAELSGDTPPTAEQWRSIKEHLALTFKKVPPVVSPSLGLPFRPTVTPWSPPISVECSAAPNSARACDNATHAAFIC